MSAAPTCRLPHSQVWIPMASILGGQERCGFGWHMFVEALAEGRGVSLPAGALAASCSVASAVGAYARIRKQFKVPIAEFGGIQEAMARAAIREVVQEARTARNVRRAAKLLALVGLVNCFCPQGWVALLAAVLVHSVEDADQTLKREGRQVRCREPNLLDGHSV